ncbi:MED14-domain-containing protein [Cylindrobasidium torrendii FP15055 ss-10]|uniref:Mediator of RNA polymerase II transcription subunit 14 n=1 Tax=Cylindrobasidium torrendii FP15055 ss-10 TaxID=1314674 RepID=A0A0D7BKP9_9AGAR|nr:MED14-domain-containing protein [Cylindrobasidium torrendii FP15055 ss-10]
MVADITPRENGISHVNGDATYTLEQLEAELPYVDDGMVYLGDLIQRVMQTIYTELSELAETMPNMSDGARKRTLADWVVKTKKQVTKLYAVTKWSRDAAVVQKCMNVIAFLLAQNVQFLACIDHLNSAREGLDPARLRNHDLLTSLDVLTTGTYKRLPTMLQAWVPIKPLTDAQVLKTFSDLEDAMRYRLRLTEFIPLEMSNYQITNGRVVFTVPHLFELTLGCTGSEPTDPWFFIDVEFLFNAVATGTQEFPRIPTGPTKRFITEEADLRLGQYVQAPPPADPMQDPNAPPPPRPGLPEGYVDAPLVRMYNFLRMMSLSYQLEILLYQAERMRSLGWAEYLRVQLSADRKTLSVSYWMRKPPPTNLSRAKQAELARIPLLAGTLTVSIVESDVDATARLSPRAKILAELQRKAKLGGQRPSEEVEGLSFRVTWDPEYRALGIDVHREDLSIAPEVLKVNHDDLDIQAILTNVIRQHTKALLLRQQSMLRADVEVFRAPGVVEVLDDDIAPSLRVRLCADEVVTVTIDPRTGLLTLRDTGDLASAGRGPRITAVTERLNEHPDMLRTALMKLRVLTLLDLAEHTAKYLGMECYRNRNFAGEPTPSHFARGMLYIHLDQFPGHYLTVVITDLEYRYALCATQLDPNPANVYGSLLLAEVAWLNYDRIHGTAEDVNDMETRAGMKRKRNTDSSMAVNQGHNLDAHVLRELYAYSCARVSYASVENQLKSRDIPFRHVSPVEMTVLPELQSSLARSVPGLCVQSHDILAGAPAAEAAMPNIRVIPLNWWSQDRSKKPQVVTCVKLKYVYIRGGGTGGIIRPSKRIIYDTTEAVVSFLSENVNTCVDEFLEEWARVSKMVVIARAVSQMDGGVRLLEFDLREVVFAYEADYTVAVRCVDQGSIGGGNASGSVFELKFGRIGGKWDDDNPHSRAEPFLRSVLHAGQLLAPSLRKLVQLLRSTLPIVKALVEEGADVFAKSAGWYRVLYHKGGRTHAVDYRLMTERRVAVLDGSQSLYHAPTPTPAQPSKVDGVGLTPIPGFGDIVRDLPGPGRKLDVSVVCMVEEVCQVAKEVHRRVLKEVDAQMES